MENDKKILKRQKRPVSRTAKFFIVLGATVGALFFVCILALGWFVWRAAKTTNPGFSGGVLAAAKEIGSNLKGVDDPNNALSNIFTELPEWVNAAVFGVDEGGDARTDVIFAALFNTKTAKLYLVSVPRDTYIVMPADRRRVLTDAGRFVPKNGVMKINAVSHYSGKELAMPFAVKQVEEVLGVEIRYYAKIDLEAFRFIVDELGGVEFDVPQRLYYNDPAQGLAIDLYPGLQTLNGKQAEGLVRYRKADEKNPISPGYPDGDIGRTKVQQAFVSALLAQMKKNVAGSLSTFTETMMRYVETNVALSDAAKFFGFLTGFSTDSVSAFTLPGTDSKIDGSWYYIQDEDATAALIEKILAGGGDEKTDTEGEIDGE